MDVWLQAELAAQAPFMFPQVSAKDNKAQPACVHVLTLAPCATFSSPPQQMRWGLKAWQDGTPSVQLVGSSGGSQG